MVKLT